MAKLGFIGLGVMGSQMVNRLLSKGHTVTGYNRTRAKAQWLVEKGMQWADSPRAVASRLRFCFRHGDECRRNCRHYRRSGWNAGRLKRGQNLSST